MAKIAQWVERQIEKRVGSILWDGKEVLLLLLLLLLFVGYRVNFRCRLTVNGEHRVVMSIGNEYCFLTLFTTWVELLPGRVIILVKHVYLTLHHHHQNYSALRPTAA